MPSNDEEIESFVSKKSEMDKEFNHLRAIENQSLHQKSRIQWLKKGNLNTSFFHRFASGCQIGNLITPSMIPLPDNTDDVSFK